MSDRCQDYLAPVTSLEITSLCYDSVCIFPIHVGVPRRFDDDMSCIRCTTSTPLRMVRTLLPRLCPLFFLRCDALTVYVELTLGHLCTSPPCQNSKTSSLLMASRTAVLVTTAATELCPFKFRSYLRTLLRTIGLRPEWSTTFSCGSAANVCETVIGDQYCRLKMNRRIWQ